MDFPAVLFGVVRVGGESHDTEGRLGEVHFEVDAEHITVATLDGLAQTGDVKAEDIAGAIDRYGLNADAPDPRLT